MPPGPNANTYTHDAFIHHVQFESFFLSQWQWTQGVGIGLSIVKHVVEAHGGRVIVRSAVGKGSRFTLVLPMSTEH